MLTHGLSRLLLLFISVSLFLLTACQQSGPRIETRQDDSSDFSNYQTYALLKSGRENSPDNEIAAYFIEAIRAEMDALGYAYSETQPDLLINYQVNIQNMLKEQGSAEPARVTDGGYYTHSQELYRGMPATEEDTRLFIERVGAARIDVIDAQKLQVIWQGDAEGHLTEAALIQPREPIQTTVAELLAQFPPREK